MTIKEPTIIAIINVEWPKNSLSSQLEVDSSNKLCKGQQRTSVTEVIAN